MLGWDVEPECLLIHVFEFPRVNFATLKERRSIPGHKNFGNVPGTFRERSHFFFMGTKIKNSPGMDRLSLRAQGSCRIIAGLGLLVPSGYGTVQKNFEIDRKQVFHDKNHLNPRKTHIW